MAVPMKIKWGKKYYKYDGSTPSISNKNKTVKYLNKKGYAVIVEERKIRKQKNYYIYKRKKK